MIKKILGAAVAVAIMATTAIAAEKPVRIGFSISKTGIFSQGAVSQINAYNLWRETLNASGGLNVAGKKRKIEFVSYDDESNPSKVGPIYEKLITNDKVDLLLPPWGTPNHLALAGVTEKYKFPVVGNTAASTALRKVKPGYLWFVTSLFPDKLTVEMAAALKSRGVKSVAVIANVLAFPQEVSNFLIPALKKAGIKVVVSAKYPPNISDMTPILTKIKNAKVDGVIVLSFPADSFLYMKQSKEIGLKNKVQFLLVGPAIAVFRKAFGAHADGILTMGHWSPLQKKWKRAMPFFNAYVKRFKIEPDYLDSAMSYMSLEILQQAVAKAGLDKEKLRQTIANGTFDTINGMVKFKGIQNVLLPPALLQIQKGKIHLVWPKSLATSGIVNR